MHESITRGATQKEPGIFKLMFTDNASRGGATHQRMGLSPSECILQKRKWFAGEVMARESPLTPDGSGTAADKDVN